ncbi:Protein SZT2 [Hypsibius exemplaris]|uniref:Protein SZT2 n=1 Tax=Hypsibius exemplaris TaxID=2072580 RepID=A0A1W0WV18_HYPEX|nr:Protein SZT2 [Hypsibius exemplaris]
MADPGSHHDGSPRSKYDSSPEASGGELNSVRAMDRETSSVEPEERHPRLVSLLQHEISPEGSDKEMDSVRAMDRETSPVEPEESRLGVVSLPQRDNNPEGSDPETNFVGREASSTEPDVGRPRRSLLSEVQLAPDESNQGLSSVEGTREGRKSLVEHLPDSPPLDVGTSPEDSTAVAISDLLVTQPDKLDAAEESREGLPPVFQQPKLDIRPESLGPTVTPVAGVRQVEKRSGILRHREDDGRLRVASFSRNADVSPDGSDLDLDPGEQATDRKRLEVRLSGSSAPSVDEDTLHSDEVDSAEEAGQVFVMMDGTFRVSRNTRAQWFLQYLNKTVVWSPEDKVGSDDFCEPLEIISCIPRRPAFPAGDTPAQLMKRSYRITQNTAMTFLSKSYRLVFALDLTPSLSAVSMINRNIAFEELFRALHDCFTAISQPALIPGTTITFAPKVFVTVVAHAPFLSAKSAPVIVKGYKLSPETLKGLLDIVHAELINLEDDMIPRLNAEVKKYSMQIPTEATRMSKPFTTMDMTLANILRKGLLSAQLLPDNSCGHIIVVTDGIVDFPDVTVMDSLLSQLRTHTISVSFIRVGYTAASSNPIGSDFGYLCNTDLMEFIAKTTSGAYVEHKQSSLGGELDGTDASIFQKAFFTWNFQQGVDGVTGDLVNQPDSLAYEAPGGRIIHQRYSPRSTLDLSVGALLSIRLREGFTIKSVAFSKGNSHIDMVLTMPWKPEISLEYRIGAAWPPTDGTPVTVEIHVEAPYEFLYDLSCPAPKNVYGKFRLATLKQFKHTVQSLEQTDMFLLHFEQFRASALHYTLPDVIRDGLPVFYFPPDDMENPIYSTEDLVEHMEFANFWKPLCVMDVNLWHKWLHAHRISLLLEHDRPLLTNIFSPKRGPTVRCDHALNQLHDLLRTWSTIVLVERHSYVRFIFDEQESTEIPKSFFIIRLAAKPPCVVLRLAFLGGTSGNFRHKIISEIEDQLTKLVVHVKSAFSSETTDVLCCWRLAKPVEKMLIQYKDVPSDMYNVSPTAPAHQDKSTQTPFPVANPGAFQALSRFLHCRRYVWLPFKGSTPTLFFDVVGRVLTALAKLRLREGFRFASTSGGVFNMTLEIEMKDIPPKTVNGRVVTARHESDSTKNDFPPCVAQYIIFPPRSVRNSVRDGDEDVESRDPKYSIAVEVWLEPQYGLSVSPKSAPYLNGQEYKGIPDRIHEVDVDLLSSFLTFETLFSICKRDEKSRISRRPWQNAIAGPSLMTSSVIAVHPTVPIPSSTFDENADILDFPFDIPRLISKCQRTRMLFCSFRQSRLAKNVDESNEILFRYFLASVRRLHAREVQLTKEDCAALMKVLHDGDGGPVSQVASLTSSSTFEEEMPPLARQIPSGFNAATTVEWKAFVQKLADNMLFVTFIPASYAHLRHVNLALDLPDVEAVGDYSSLSTGVQSDSTAVSHGEGDSETGEEFVTSRRPSALPVPVFLFHCTFESLQSAIVDERPLSRKSNMEFDLTKNFNCVYDRMSKRVSECRPDESAGSDRASSSMRSASFSMRTHKDNSKLFVVFGALEDAFAKAFVQGVYKSLHLGLDVDPYDIQTASDGLCDETPIDLDLTTFIKAICEHFRELTSRRTRRQSGNRKSSEGASSMSQLYPRPPAETHSSIREQFKMAVSGCLKHSANRPEVFYFALPGFHDSNGGGEGASTSEVDMNSSDVSESSVEFRLDSVSAGNLRESVSGISEAESLGQGFFKGGSGDSSRSVFGSEHSATTAERDMEEYDENEEGEEDEDGLKSPLFVEFFCSVVLSESKKQLGHFAVKDLPTCLNEILTVIDSKGDLKTLDLHDIQIRLEVLCLYLPDELKNIPPLDGRTAIRTISGGSSVNNLRGSDSDVSTIHEGSTAVSEVGDLIQLPLEQSEKVRNMVESLKWHLQDEIAYMLSKGEGMPSEENLRLVVDHVQHATSRKRFTCVEQKIPLKFVFNVEQSFGMFIERFEKSVISGFEKSVIPGFEKSVIQRFRFVKEGEFYCLIRCPTSPQLARRRLPSQQYLTDGMAESLAKVRARSPSVDSELHPAGQRKRHTAPGAQGSRRASLPVYTLNREMHGIVNPVNNADIKAINRMPSIRDSSVTDDEACVFEGGEVGDPGYDAGSSESEEEEQEVNEPTEETPARGQLPEFWLILRLTSSEAGLFFHVRESESSAEMEKYRELIDEVARKIKSAAKVVNQVLILKDLLATRRCINLLEQETSDELWKGSGGPGGDKLNNPDDGDNEAADSSYLQASLTFAPGFFRCDVVYEHEFIIHPRLKVGPGRVASRAVKALSDTLNKFAVVNRQNMFVLEDTGKDPSSIFYFRFQEKIVGRRMTGPSLEDSSQLRGSSSAKDLEQTPTGSLLESENLTPRSAVALDEIDGAGCNTAATKNDTIIFSFYGICDVSGQISTDLVTVLQNRLDEAVLESLNMSLSRNTMLKLNADDVRFIQPVKSEPGEILELELPAPTTATHADLFRVFHYVLQNLCGFLHCPKYGDFDVDRHFHFMDAKGRWEPADDEASFLYRDAGNRGLAFIYVVLSSEKAMVGDDVSMMPDGGFLENLKELTTVFPVTSGGDLSFHIWEKGNIDRTALRDKLSHTVHHALLDYWMEKSVVPSLRQQPGGTSLPAANCSLLQAYLKIGVDCKCPAYQSSSFTLPSRRAVDLIAEQIVGVVSQQNLSLNVAALISKVDEEVETDITEAKIEGPASIKELLLPRVKNLVPGTFVCCRVLGMPPEEGDVYERRTRSVSTDAAGCEDKAAKMRTLKRFLSRVDHIGSTTVPRSRLMFFLITDVLCQVYLYNFSPDTATAFEKAVARLFEWHHERHRFLHNVLLQKCGIFQPMAVFESRPSAEGASFTASPMQADLLFSYSNVPTRDNTKNPHNAKYSAMIPGFHTVMEAGVPTRLFADPERGNYDPVKYHGKQFQEIRQRKKRANEVRARLYELYELWRARDRRRPATEDWLTLLKANAKAAHFCASPLLFDPQWRRNLSNRFPDRQLQCATPIHKGGNCAHEDEPVTAPPPMPPGTRSRHSSGVPVSTPKEKVKPATTAATEQARRISGPTPDQLWHTQIRTILMTEYVHYLQMQGFSVVFLDPPTSQRHVKKSPQGTTRATSGTSSPTPVPIPSNVPAPMPRFTPACTYLQRCVPGGMILLELYYFEPFLFSRLYALDRCKFSDDYAPVGGDPDKALLNLQREIDRLKVAMHMHSFLYDFHLRRLMDYLSGKHLIFKQGYHLVSFFDDFGNYYQKPPSYAKSSFQSGTLTVPCGSLPASQLYHYILTRDKLYGLNAVRMSSVQPDDESDTTFALACSAIPCPDQAYEYSFIVYADTHEPQAPGNSELILRYYIILSSKEDMFSTDYLEERFGSFKTLPPPKKARTSLVEAPAGGVSAFSLMPIPASFDIKDPVRENLQDRPGVIHGSTDNMTAKASLVSAFPANFLYIGYFSRLETELHRIVLEQKVVLEKFIRTVLARANTDCVRDTLWRRLTSVGKGVDDDAAKRRADFAQARHREDSGSAGRLMSDSYRNSPKLTPAEFEELIAHVYREPVIKWDPELSVFLHANASWLDGLLDTLKTKYWEVQRFFVSPSSQGSLLQTQHLVIVCQNVQDITLYLSLRAGASSLDASVLSRNPISLEELRKNSVFVEFMQGFVNACCFHMWKAGLPS